VPELADVEGFRRVLARFAAGHRIDHVKAGVPAVIRNTSPQGLGRALHGRRFGPPRRHGKWLIAPAEGRLLVLHFGMTGVLSWTKGAPRDEPDDAVTFRTGSGVLHYRTKRKLGGVWLVRDESGLEAVTGPLGPDAAAIGREAFVSRLGERRGGVKSALMDQSLLAGIGNELSDEILWRARIAPRARPAALSEGELDALYDAMREVLRESMKHGRIPDESGWLESVREERDAACPRCGAALSRRSVAGRTALWCPQCQRSDRRAGSRGNG